MKDSARNSASVQDFVDSTVKLYSSDVATTTDWTDLKEWTQFATDGTDFPYRVNRFTIKKIFRDLDIFEKLNDAGMSVKQVGRLIFIDSK